MEMAAAMKTNPTIFIQSAEDPDNDNTRWGSISHDNVSMIIDSGSDNITLDDDTFISGDAVLGDNQVGEDVFSVEFNGTVTVLGMVSPDGTTWKCWVDNAGSWQCE